MPKENTCNGMLMGTMIGGAIGAVAALLLAPKSGVQLREDLSSKFQSISKKTQDIASTVGNKATDLVSTVKEEVSELADHAKDSN